MMYPLSSEVFMASRRRRREPVPRKTPLERWMIRQGRIVTQLLLFIPASLVLIYFMPKEAQAQASAIIVFGTIAIITGKVQL
jgi:hypothetical protein